MKDNSLDNYELKTVNDYRFLACVIAEKLRNTNFEASKRQIFLKTLLEQLRPCCSFKAYQRIEKSVKNTLYCSQDKLLTRRTYSKKHRLRNKRKRATKERKISNRLKIKGVLINLGRSSMTTKAKTSMMITTMRTISKASTQRTERL